MEELALLTSLAVFTLLAAACSIIFNKIRLPPLIGYIVAGIIIANVWTITNDSEQIVSILSDIGLVMLMFCIGLEINLRKIRKQGLFAMGVVIIQLPLMMLGGIVAGMLLGYDMVQCICLGAIISGSSTAVVMAVLKSQKELDADHKESLVLVLIMEDIGQVIILSMITPIMASNDPSVDVNSLIVMIVSIIVFMVASIVVGLKLIPRAINWVSDNVSDEILTVFSVGLAFGMALLSIYIGLSMAIGAFLMGMMMKSKEINHKIEPMRDLFMAIFFISIGMEITVSSLIDNIGTIIVLYLIFLILIVVAVFIAYWVENETCRNGFLSAVSLATMGEFAFIIASEALGFGAIDQSFYTSVVGAALLSMIILPFLSRYSPRIWDKSVEKCPRPIYATCCRLNETRERVYSRVYATSKKSRKAMYRSMTHSYINILAIAAIEIAFYFLIPVCVDWITANFGGTRDLWSIVMLMVNFAVLMMPVYHLVNNVKFLDEMIIGGARRIAKREGNLSEPGAIYQRFLEINTYIMVLIIVALIVIICPNSVGLWQHLVVLGLAAIVLAVFYLKRLRDDRRRPPSPQRTQTPDQDDEGDDL